MTRMPLGAAQDALLASCVLPGCPNIVDAAGDACSACVAFWGPYLGRQGERSAWQPSHVPACHHGITWWRRGQCDRCGCTELVAS